MSKLTGSNLRRAFLFLFCASLVACQAAFGVYKTGEVGGTAATSVGGAANVGGNSSNTNGGSSSGGGTAASSCNSEGTYRCTNTAIEVCKNGSWHSFVSCSSDLCDAVQGNCMVCAPGSHRCSAFNLQTCSDAGNAWSTSKQCATAEYCDSVSNNCFKCLAGEALCDGAELYKCNTAQSQWDMVQCDSPDLCDARAQTCQKCSGTDWLGCNGSTLIGCNNGAHVTLADCGSSQLCQQTLDEHTNNPSTWSGKCVTGCTPNTYQCNPDNPAELRACSPSGIWESVETCLTPELCDAANKKCDTGCGVPPGTYRCEGAQLEVCKSDGIDFEQLKLCPDSDHCNPQLHDCIACTPGEYHCNNSTLQACNADHTLTDVTRCASAALCDATSGVCVDPPCLRAGDYECNGAVLRQCNADLTGWTDKETCVNVSHCDAANGRCKPIGCLYPNTYRCQGNTRQICDDTTRNYIDVNTCTDAELCDLTDPSGCVSASACPSPSRCNVLSGGAAEAQTCAVVNDKATWTTVDTCATVALCNATPTGASCTKPTCTADQYVCQGNALKRCNAGRTDYDAVATCTGSTPVCDVVNKQCSVCTPYTFSCYQVNSNPGRQLLLCAPDGKANNVVNNCQSADLCYTSADKLTGYCIACALGDTQCSGSSQIRSCLADRSGWAPATTCSSGCVDSTGNTDYCATCAEANNVSEVQCVQTAAPGSIRTCAADQKSWGSTTTCALGYGCVESGTADYCSTGCVANASECLAGIGMPGTALTGQHTCNADGKTWGATKSECVDSSNLKTCANGALTSTKTPCPTSTPYCVSGQCVQCTGTGTKCDSTTANKLLTCTNGIWTPSTCSGTNVCYNGACVACTSASYAATCTSDTSLKYCTSNNTVATATCASLDSTKPNCNNGTCGACSNSGYSAICLDNTTLQDCSSGSLASTNCSTLASTPVCYQGTTGAEASCAACNGNTAPVCLADGKTRQYCFQGSLAKTVCTGSCVGAGVCTCDATSGAKCTNNNTTLTTCDTTTGTWTDSPCTSPKPVCGGSPSQCVQCNDSSYFKCSGSGAVSTTRHSCANNLNVDDSCAAGQVCYPPVNVASNAICDAPACAVNEHKCNGNVLQTCNSSRTGWVDLTCNSSQACNPTGTCDPIICTPGKFQCTGSGLATCNATGTAWTSTKTCASGQYCNATAGTCDPIVCNPSTDVRCFSNTLQACNPYGTGWVDSLVCTAGTQICNVTTGTCDAVICTANQKSCSSTSILATCNSTGTGSTNSPCATGTVCEGSPGAAACAPVTCTANQKSCVSADTLSTCNSSGTGSTNSPCATGTVCEGSPGAATCATVICTANQKSCTSATTLATCNSTGTVSTDTTCDTGTVCDASAGTATCAALVCTASALGCSSANTVQTCNLYGTGWTDPGSTCAAPTPVCSAGACVACASSADCSGITPLCALGVCIGCTVNTDCSNGGTCQADGSCIVH